jgi:hypothetical protein
MRPAGSLLAVITTIILMVAGCKNPSAFDFDTSDGNEAAFLEVLDITINFESRLTYLQTLHTPYMGVHFGKENTVSRFSSSYIPFLVKDLQSGGFSENVIGLCWYRWNGSRDIQYDTTWWSKLSEIQKRFVVYHENGHCQLSLKHNCMKLSSGFVDVMYPFMPSEEFLTKKVPGINGLINMDYMELLLFYKKKEIVPCVSNEKAFKKNGDIGHPLYYTEDEKEISDDYYHERQ